MTTENTKPAAGDEAAIEHTVRGILQRLDRQIDTANSWGCSLFGLVLAPLLFLGLWWWYTWSPGAALALAVGVPLVMWIAFWNWYDRSAAQREAIVFDQHFPPGHVDRDLALQMLAEMPYPSRAHEKLRAALGKRG